MILDQIYLWNDILCPFQTQLSGILSIKSYDPNRNALSLKWTILSGLSHLKLDPDFYELIFLILLLSLVIEYVIR